MELLELNLKNVFPFKEAHFSFDHKGITIVRGLNMDGAPGTTNAAGKSALLGAIPELVLDESPTGKVDKVKGVKEPKSRIRLSMRRGKHVYDLIRTIGKGKNYEILKDGKSTEVRTVAYSQDKIRRLFGLSETKFYTQFYLDGTIPHPLIVGKASAKQEFIVELFDLGNIDKIRSLLNAELTAMSKKAVEHKTLVQQMDELKDRLLPKEKRKRNKERLAELKSVQEQMSAKLQASQAVSELIAFEQSNRKLIAALSEICQITGVKETYKEVRAKVRKLEFQREAWNDWKAYWKQSEKYAELEAPARALLEKLGVSAEQAEVKAKRYDELSAEFKSRERQMQSLKKIEKPAKVEEPKYDRDTCSAKVSHLREELKTSKGAKDGVCPTCGSKIDARDSQEIDAELQKWVGRLNECVKYESYTKKRSEWKTYSKQVESIVDTMEDIQRTMEKLRPYKKAYSEYESLPSPPLKPESEEPAEWSSKKLDKAVSKMNVLRQAMDVEDMLVRLSKVTDKERERATRANELFSQLNEINAEVSSLSASTVQQDDLVSQLRSLKEKVNALAEVIKDEKLLRALVSAYSTSGLKKFMIERYSKMLEQQINKYRRIFFSENYEFEFRYESKLSVIVHRKYDKKTRSSDVRKLSGAEKRMFTLLLFVATTSMMPARQRLNTLILDEPESQMGDIQIEQFIRSLPVLQKLVPHIIIITPRSFEIPGSRVFTVVKKNGVARVVEGLVKRGIAKKRVDK